METYEHTWEPSGVEPDGSLVTKCSRCNMAYWGSGDVCSITSLITCLPEHLQDIRRGVYRQYFGKEMIEWDGIQWKTFGHQSEDVDWSYDPRFGKSRSWVLILDKDYNAVVGALEIEFNCHGNRVG